MMNDDDLATFVAATAEAKEIRMKQAQTVEVCPTCHSLDRLVRRPVHTRGEVETVEDCFDNWHNVKIRQPLTDHDLMMLQVEADPDVKRAKVRDQLDTEYGHERADARSYLHDAPPKAAIYAQLAIANRLDAIVTELRAR